jgi:hypothetical protein
MTFKVFDAYGAAARPEATLRASGQLFLSRGILKRSGREDATFYQLQFDEDTDRLAVKACRKYDESSETGVREALQEKSGIAINVIPLLRYYNFPMPKTKIVLPVTFESGLVVVDLKELRNQSAGGRKAAALGEDNHGSGKNVEEQRTEDFDDDIPF